MERKNTVFLTIIAVATLLVAVVGATFAYFSVQVTGNEAATSTVIKTANIKITYTAGTDIEANLIEPGWDKDLKFTVENEGDYELSYYIRWNDVSNDFDQANGRASELYYTISCQSGLTCGKTLARTNAPVADGVIDQAAGAITIAAGATHSYNVHMYFEETNSEQNYNQGKSFSGSVNIELAGDTLFSTDNVYTGK